MDYALDEATNGPQFGPNPRVGCVLLAPASDNELRRHIIAGGWHEGAGTPHAEVAAITDARLRGIDTRGATAVVTLEPCNHTGLTKPCTDALLNAGITEVVYAIDDPGADSGGGADYLRARGVHVWQIKDEMILEEARELVLRWYHAIKTGRPYVTVKLAMSLDGRIAAADGTSQWITGLASRRHGHVVRSTVDAIAVTTGTALHDNPSLTARDEADNLAAHQPLRVVVGMRDLPADANLYGPGGDLLHLRTHDVHAVLAALQDRQIRHLLVEGGPALTTALFAAGLVDEIHVYIAPVLLGAGTEAVSDFGITTLADAPRWHNIIGHREGEDAFFIVRTAPRTWVFDLEADE